MTSLSSVSSLLFASHFRSALESSESSLCTVLLCGSKPNIHCKCLILPLVPLPHHEHKIKHHSYVMVHNSRFLSLPSILKSVNVSALTHKYVTILSLHTFRLCPALHQTMDSLGYRECSSYLTFGKCLSDIC